MLFNFDISNNNLLFLFIALCVVAVGLYYFFSSSIIDSILKSDDAMQKAVKQTLHEINTPVSTILMNTKMIKNGTQDEKTIKRLNRIENSCNDLLQLYLQMEYSLKQQIDAIEKVEFLLDESVKRSIEKFDDIKQNITIHNTLNTNIVLKTDKNGFEKVIDNLLSNAIKYNYQNGNINISFFDNWLSFENDGDDIDTKNILMIFQEHYQQDSNSSGFGLGLSIIKEFCDQNKIEIKINSSNNKTKIKLNLRSIVV
jgi:signal transduction histidine kinase